MRVVWRADSAAESSPRVQWTFLGTQRLLSPFFDQTMQRQMSHPFHQLFLRETSIADLVSWADRSAACPLRGLIFHMSRCGSTLAAQMLAAPLHHVVASEPPPLDAVLRAPTQLPSLAHTTHVQWVQAIVKALGQPRTGMEDSFFLKLDCWHIHQITLLCEAFPQIPCIFLYRDPVEVLMSHVASPAPWTIPGMLHSAVLHLAEGDWNPQRQEDYCAKAVAKFCAGAVQAAKRKEIMLVNYNELPQAMFGRVAACFKLQLADMPAMLEQSMRNAKSPEMAFEADSAAKQLAAGSKVRDAAKLHLQPVYDELEELRREQVAGGC